MKKRVLIILPICLCVTGCSLFAKKDVPTTETKTQTETVLSDATEMKTGNLLNIDANQSFSATVKYEKNDVTIIFIMPDGTEIDGNIDGITKDNCSITRTDTSTTLIVMDAQNGQWMIKYNKGSNESLTVSFAEIEKTTY